MLLPEVLWPRRTDAAEVIGAGLEIAAAGLGHRRIAAKLGRAEDTVRGWVRRFRTRSEEVRLYFTVALVAVADDPVMPEPAGSPVADAVLAVALAHQAAAAKWPRVLTVSPWPDSGDAIDWDDVAERSGLRFPADYRDFVTIYGGGSLNNNFYVAIPCDEEPGAWGPSR